jgi:pilus assembly protein CpaD
MSLKISTIGASLILLATVSACATKNNGMRDNAGAEPIHKANVSFEETSHPIRFENGKLSASEDASLAAFAAASGLSYADRLTLRVSEANMAADYRHALNTVLGRFGLAVGNVEAATGLPSGIAMLAVSRPTVTLPDCGVHDGPHTFNVNNENMSNYGCAVRSNLAAMVANPADLISGNRLDGQPANVTAKPVDAFGAHELTGMKAEGDKKNWTPQGPLPK